MDEYGDEVEKLILTHGKTYVDKRLMENTLGLVGEAGEFAEKIKKQIRDGNEINQLELVKELGDVLFYVCLLYTSPSPRDKRQSRMPSSA